MKKTIAWLLSVGSQLRYNIPFLSPYHQYIRDKWHNTRSRELGERDLIYFARNKEASEREKNMYSDYKIP